MNFLVEYDRRRYGSVLLIFYTAQADEADDEEDDDAFDGEEFDEEEFDEEEE